MFFDEPNMVLRYVSRQPSHLTTYLLKDVGSYDLIYTIYTGFTKFINCILRVYVFMCLNPVINIVLLQAKKI